LKSSELASLLGWVVIGCAIPDVEIVSSLGGGTAGDNASGGLDRSGSGGMSSGGRQQANGGMNAQAGGSAAASGTGADGGNATGGEGISGAGGNATGGKATGGNAMGGNATAGTAAGGAAGTNGPGGAGNGGAGNGGAGGASVTTPTCTDPGHACDSTQVCNTQYGRCVLKTGPCAVVDPDQLFCDDFESASIDPKVWSTNDNVSVSTLVAHSGKRGMLLQGFNTAVVNNLSSFAGEYPIRVSFWVKSGNYMATPQTGPLATFNAPNQKSWSFGVFGTSFGFIYYTDDTNVRPTAAQSAAWDDMEWMCIDIQVTNDHAFVARERTESSTLWHQIGPVTNADFGNTDTVVGTPGVGGMAVPIWVDDFVVAKNDSSLGVCAP
jgi:hypothetical protein